MKKFILLAAVSSLLMITLTGCVDMADMQGMDIKTIEAMQEADGEAVPVAASTIEGYCLVAGSLEELDSEKFSMETADGHALSFRLMPETLLFKGEGKRLTPGDEITVVFEGDLAGTNTDGVSVIAVSAESNQ